MQEPLEHIIDFGKGVKNTLQIYRSVENVDTVIFCWPALGVRASYYQSMGVEMARNGFHFATMDWRGNGTSNIRPSYDVDFGYKELIEDAVISLNELRKKFPDSRIVVLGHSLGGQIGALTMARYPKMIDALVAIASCTVYYRGFGKGGTKVKWAARIIPTIATIFGHFPGNILKFGGREAQQLMKDWAHNGLTNRYEPKGDDFDYETAMKESLKPFLALSLEGDDMAPFDAVENLMGKYESSLQKEHRVVTSENVGIEKVNHFNWVKHPMFLIQTIKQWLGTLE